MPFEPTQKPQDEWGNWRDVQALPPHLRKLHRMQELPGEPKRRPKPIVQAVKELAQTELGKLFGVGS